MTIEIEESQRQLILLGLAILSLDRPGFEYACREAAKPFDNGTEMFDGFRAANADQWEDRTGTEVRRTR